MSLCFQRSPAINNNKAPRASTVPFSDMAPMPYILTQNHVFVLPTILQYMENDRDIHHDSVAPEDMQTVFK